MKRIGNIYNKLYDFSNIMSAYNEVMKTTRNKNSVVKFNLYKCIYVNKIRYIMIFTIRHIFQAG